MKIDFIYERTVNYYETDKMGIVHHSNHIRYLEESRCKWLDALNIPLQYFEKQGFMMPVLEVNCEYKTAVTVGDVITIKPIFTQYNGVRFTISYEVLNAKTKQTIIKAFTKHCFTNDKLYPINMKKYDKHVDEIFLDNLVSDFI